MRLETISWIVMFLGLYLAVNGQDRDPNTSYFLVEEEKFNPPDSDIISHYIGKSAMVFIAKDMNQREQYLDDYLGKLVLLWFWNTENLVCLEAIKELNQMNEELSGQFSLISFADEDRATLNDFLVANPINFPIIPNAGIFGEGAYAQELGYPRLFFLDGQGKIQCILPSSFFSDSEAPFEDIRAMILADIN